MILKKKLFCKIIKFSLKEQISFIYQPFYSLPLFIKITCLTCYATPIHLPPKPHFVVGACFSIFAHQTPLSTNAKQTKTKTQKLHELKRIFKT